MSFFENIYFLAIEILSFYVPLVYAFKFLMDRQTTKIRTTLKFWSMISCYRLIAFLLQHILDENVFPLINIIMIVILCLPPYQIVEKVYDSTLGVIFKKNKESFLAVEDTVLKIFDKNTQKLSKKVQDKTGEKMKGLVGGMLVAAMNNSSKEPSTQETREVVDSDSDDNSDKSQ